MVKATLAAAGLVVAAAVAAPVPEDHRKEIINYVQPGVSPQEAIENIPQTHDRRDAKEKPKPWHPLTQKEAEARPLTGQTVNDAFIKEATKNFRNDFAPKGLREGHHEPKKPQRPAEEIESDRREKAEAKDAEKDAKVEAAEQKKAAVAAKAAEERKADFEKMEAQLKDLKGEERDKVAKLWVLKIAAKELKNAEELQKAGIVSRDVQDTQMTQDAKKVQELQEAQNAQRFLKNICTIL